MTDHLAVRRNDLMPALTIEEAVSRYNAVVEFTKRVMKKDKDYGVIPGTGNKPTLLKPGAEKLCSLFGLNPKFTITDKIVDFDAGLFYFHYNCDLFRGEQLVASGEGSCNSKEKKYRYRNIPEKKATEEEKATALRVETKNGQYGPYKVYVIENTEPFDLINTIQKMAQKRAMVAATLIGANASEFFTQDIEDMEILEGEFIDVEKQVTTKKTKKAKQQETESTNGNRPYPPHILKAKIEERSQAHATKLAPEINRNILGKMLKTTFEGDDTKRYEFSKWAFTESSVKKIPDAYIWAAFDWLGISGKDFNEVPCEHVIAEVNQALPIALKAQGQAELL